VVGALWAAALLAGAPAWSPDTEAAAAFARTRPGAVSYSVRTPCGEWGRAQDRVFPSASLLKPLLLVAYLRRPGVRSRALTRRERALLGPMIRRSANEPANELVVRLGAAAIERAARRAGLRRFRLRSPWGVSDITARDQARFWLRIDRRVPPRHRAYARALLGGVVPAQSWGVADVAPRGWRLYFKGGWGRGGGWAHHQSALLTRGPERVSLSILTRDQGSHAAGTATLRGIARRVLRGLARARAICAPARTSASTPSATSSRRSPR
jgi:hypothetical protein